MFYDIINGTCIYIYCISPCIQLVVVVYVIPDISIELLTILTVVVCVQAIAINLSDSDTRHIGDEIN